MSLPDDPSKTIEPTMIPPAFDECHSPLIAEQIRIRSDSLDSKPKSMGNSPELKAKLSAVKMASFQDVLQINYERNAKPSRLLDTEFHSSPDDKRETRSVASLSSQRSISLERLSQQNNIGVVVKSAFKMKESEIIARQKHLRNKEINRVLVYYTGGMVVREKMDETFESLFNRFQSYVMNDHNLVDPSLTYFFQNEKYSNKDWLVTPLSSKVKERVATKLIRCISSSFR